MKQHEHKHCHLVWGVMIALFGIFFLIANLTTHEILRFWPIFLIGAGAYKAFSGCCLHNHHCNK